MVTIVLIRGYVIALQLYILHRAMVLKLLLLLLAIGCDDWLQSLTYTLGRDTTSSILVANLIVVVVLSPGA